MPELPEVETIARTLREGSGSEPPVVGRKILSVAVRWTRHIALPDEESFRQRCAGQVVRSVARRGKFLRLQLTRDTMLVHLRMSGDLRAVPSTEPLRKHDLTIWHLDGGVDLRFHDPRRFGRVWLTADPGGVLGRLGPEPLAPGFSADRLKEMLGARKRLLKPLLLDQSFLAGLGNIYTDEALHRAKLHPLRRSDTLRPQEVSRLWRGIRAVLRAGIRWNGASIDGMYRGGGYQNRFRVYGRSGERCRACSGRIRRILVGQRSTYYCPRCQRIGHPKKKK